MTLSLQLEKYCYNTLKWHTLIDQREQKKEREKKKNPEEKHGREERLIKRSSKTPHGGSYRETSEGLWFCTFDKKKKKQQQQPGSTFFQKKKKHLKRELSQ